MFNSFHQVRDVFMLFCADLKNNRISWVEWLWLVFDMSWYTVWNYLYFIGWYVYVRDQFLFGKLRNHGYIPNPFYWDVKPKKQEKAAFQMMGSFYNFQIVNGKDGSLFSEQKSDVVDVACNMVYFALMEGGFDKVTHPFKKAFAFIFCDMAYRNNINRQMSDNVAKQFFNAMVAS